MLKKLSALILVILLLVYESACSGNGGGEKEFAAPDYVVSDFAGSLDMKYVGGVKMNSEGQPVIYENNGGSHRYITVDDSGNSIHEVKCDFNGAGNIFAFDENDNLYILAQDCVMEENGYRVKENTRQLLVYDATGEKLSGVELGKVVMQKDEDIYVRGMAVDSKGNIYLVKNNETPELVDQNGKSLKSPISGILDFLDIDGDDNIIGGVSYADAVKPFIACMEPNGGKEIWKTEMDIGTYVTSISYSKKEKCVYILTNKGVDRYDSKGNLSGTVLSFMKYNLLSEDTYINDVCVDSSGSLYLLLNERESARIKKFEISDENAQSGNDKPNQKPVVEKKIITLAANYSDRWLESAVSRFQAGRPDVEISVKDYKGAFFGGSDTVEESKKRQEQFTATINTELMAGKGPDIICFSSDLPYRKYIDKNMFINLSSLMEKDKGFNKNELNFNVIDALKYKNGFYVMPINYQFEMLYASKTILDKEGIIIDDRNWTWNDFMEIAEKVTKDTNNDGVTDRYAAYTTTNRGIFPYLFSYDKYVDIEKRKASFTDGNFVNMLNSCKAFNDKKLFFEAGSFSEADEMSKRGGITFMLANIPGYGFVSYIMSNYFSGDIQLLHMPSDNATDTRGINFGSSNMFAINRNTKYQDEAWEFLKLLLSKKQQADPSLQNGFPVNNEALKDFADLAVNYLSMNRKTIDAINEFIPDVGKYHYSDVQISSIIREGVNDFFSGNKSAEETANFIQNKVELYLNE